MNECTHSTQCLQEKSHKFQKEQELLSNIYAKCINLEVFLKLENHVDEQKLRCRSVLRKFGDCAKEGRHCGLIEV